MVRDAFNIPVGNRDRAGRELRDADHTDRGEKRGSDRDFVNDLELGWRARRCCSL
jgi:hypothetical protein